jgi:hypothetical protein
MGKGSRQRPTDHKKFSDHWEKIFGPAKNLYTDPVSVYTKAVNGPQGENHAAQEGLQQKDSLR